MWHVSASSPLGRPTAWRMAERELDGLGDADLGEWRETGPSAVHLRRRLTAAEAEPVGEARDIRGTDEERHRFRRLLNEAPQLRGFIRPP